MEPHAFCQLLWNGESEPAWPEKKIAKLALKTDPEGLKEIGKSAHDITAGLRTLQFAVESIAKGYRFDDSLADAKIKAMERAVSQLNKETELLLHILKSAF